MYISMIIITLCHKDLFSWNCVVTYFYTEKESILYLLRSLYYVTAVIYFALTCSLSKKISISDFVFQTSHTLQTHTFSFSSKNKAFIWVSQVSQFTSINLNITIKPESTSTSATATSSATASYSESALVTYLNTCFHINWDMLWYNDMSISEQMSFYIRHKRYVNKIFRMSKIYNHEANLE